MYYSVQIELFCYKFLLVPVGLVFLLVLCCLPVNETNSELINTKMSPDLCLHKKIKIMEEKKFYFRQKDGKY